MKVYTCNDFSGHYPVGTSAVITANDKESARALLLTELKRIGLDQKDEIFSVLELSLSTSKVTILQDGDY